MRRDALRSYVGDLLETTRQFLRMRVSWRDLFSVIAFLIAAFVVTVLLTLRGS